MTAQAIIDARKAVVAMFDAVRPYLDDPIPRETVVAPYDAALAALHDALYSATKPARRLLESEDGTAPATRDG